MIQHKCRRMFGKPPSSGKIQAIRRRRHDDEPDEEDEESSSLGFFDMDAEEVQFKLQIP